MRFSELGGKEIIDLNNGSRVGTAGQTDLVVDSSTGMIQAMILPGSTLFGFHRKREGMMVPWKSIRTVGAEMIIIDVKEGNPVNTQES